MFSNLDPPIDLNKLCYLLTVKYQFLLLRYWYSLRPVFTALSIALRSLINGKENAQIDSLFYPW